MSEREIVCVRCGVDEAGCGPLAGPVFAAAVVLALKPRINGLADSKVLSAAIREKLAVRIKQRALAWAVASASVEEIDTLNILQARLLAMKRAIEMLSLVPTEIVVDGLHCPRVAAPVRGVVRGDATIRVISAASILAKTARDAVMLELHQLHPQYGFDHHKGYATEVHLSALRRHGPCPIHRRSFEPVRMALGAEQVDST